MGFEPLRSGQLVILFKDNPQSGATQGYFGTIQRVLTKSLIQHPSRPDLWIYLVYFPYLECEFEFRAREFFVTGGHDPAAIDSGRYCEIQFDAPLAIDNDEVFGAYRLPARDWDQFVFRKFEQSQATYQLNWPVTSPRTMASLLCYNVPTNAILNREYILRAIAEIIGLEQPGPEGAAL